MTCPIKLWGNGIIAPLTSSTITVTAQRSTYIANPNLTSTANYTFVLLPSTSARDGAAFFWSDWDPDSNVTLTADVPISVPGRGFSTSVTLLSGTIIGLVYVAAQGAWIPVSYFHT